MTPTQGQIIRMQGVLAVAMDNCVRPIVDQKRYLLKSSVIFEYFTIVRILFGKSTQCTSKILNYNILAFYFADFLT